MESIPFSSQRRGQSRVLNWTLNSTIFNSIPKKLQQNPKKSSKSEFSLAPYKLPFFELVRSSENIHAQAHMFFCQMLKVTLLEKCIKLNLCWWRQQMIPNNCSKLLGGYYKTWRHFPHFADELFQALQTICFRKKQHFDSFIISASSITISVSYIQYNILEGKFPLQTSFMESCVQVFIMLCFIRFHWISLDLGESLGFPWIRLVTFYIWDISYVFSLHQLSCPCKKVSSTNLWSPRSANWPFLFWPRDLLDV